MRVDLSSESRSTEDPPLAPAPSAIMHACRTAVYHYGCTCTSGSSRSLFSGVSAVFFEFPSQDVFSGEGAGGAIRGGAVASHVRSRNPADARDSAGMERCQQVWAVLRMVLLLMRCKLGGKFFGEELARSLRLEASPSVGRES